MSGVELVWFKRDLRLRDHAPLAAAATRGPVLCVFVHEPTFEAAAEFDPMHACFRDDCLRELRAGLAALGAELLEIEGPLPEAFDRLHTVEPIARLWSHEETGPGWTYARDLAVARWCRQRGILWTELPQTGVVRRLESRDGWAQRWEQRMSAREAVLPPRLIAASPQRLADSGIVAIRLPRTATDPPRPLMPRGGESLAWRTLEDFLATRGVDYRRGMSSPVTAFERCSRLGPYLAWGAISMRALHQRVERRRMELAAACERGIDVDRRWWGSLQSFSARLRWHCHFMQKLEDEPRIEFENFSRAFDSLREREFARDRFEAWCSGRTGYPLVDACMRALRATGWVNFRMRALLVSFAAYQIWLHWREPAVFLARHFVDFEPGIHFSQVQMQSGTTGINALRIYSPLKQQQDQDPHGEFVRRWVPELAAVPAEWLTRLPAMPGNLQRRYGVALGRDYPLPIVDHERATATARERLTALRRTAAARAEADRVQARHGSRRSGLPQPVRRSSHDRRASRRRPPLSHQATFDFDVGSDKDDRGI
jgi:deoxyribodipyrimidine photo-lyase